ncbi:MAG: thiamine phosphate synthase [Oceanococcaceae bacterium]
MTSRGIYLLIDPDVLDPAHWPRVLPAVLEQPLALVQLRCKRRGPQLTQALADSVADWCVVAGRPLLINDDVGLAQTVGAAGVHLGQGDGSVIDARARLGPEAIIGRTCHADLALVDQAVADGVSYLSIGAMYPSSTKPGARPATRATLRAAIQRSSVPVCAIGGIGPNQVPALRSDGASLLAVCGAILRAPDPAEAARDLVRLFGDEPINPAV